MVTLTSNQPVTWSLTPGSAGSLTVGSSTSAAYYAPSSVNAANALGGCQTTPNDSVFNTRIDNLPLEEKSAQWLANMGTNSLSFFTDWGTNIADAATPVVNEKFFYTTPYNGPFLVPSWPLLKRQGGTFVSDKNNSDHHIMTVDKDSCQFYEIYNNYFSPRTCRDGSPGCTATSGLTYSWGTYLLPSAGSTIPSNLPLAPLMLHLSEMKAGAIHHAMAFTVAGGYISGDVPLWPANSTNACRAVCRNSPPYGARFRLKADFDISSYSPQAQVVLTALQQYGMFLADAGTGPTVYVDTDVTEDAGALGALGEIGNSNIKWSSFEAVGESSFIVNTASSRVYPSNGYQTPDTYAVVSAISLANPASQAQIPVALQSNIPAVSSPTLYIIAGIPAYHLASWLRTGSDAGVTWTALSGPGSVTPSTGAYTPPQSVSAPSEALLRVSLDNDPSLSEYVYVTVLPGGINPTGSIRIDTGNPSGSVDGYGNRWLADQALETGGYRQVTGDYPAWPLATNPEIKIFQSSGSTYGNDMVYSLALPNGKYKVRLLFGEPYNGCGSCVGGVFDPHLHAPLLLEANGQIGAHNFDFGRSIGYAYATPVDTYIPALVTGNTLQVAVRANLPDLAAAAQKPKLTTPILNGLEIIPDSSIPHITIDTQSQTSVAAGSTLQLYAIGWYLNNTVVWSVLSGPGSIDQSGLYHAPDNAPSAPQTVVIRAGSTLRNSAIGFTTLTIPAP